MFYYLHRLTSNIPIAWYYIKVLVPRTLPSPVAVDSEESLNHFAIVVKRHLLIELNVSLLDSSTGAQPFPTNIRVIQVLTLKSMTVVQPSFYLMLSIILLMRIYD